MKYLDFNDLDSAFEVDLIYFWSCAHQTFTLSLCSLSIYIHLCVCACVFQELKIILLVGEQNTDVLINCLGQQLHKQF